MLNQKNLKAILQEYDNNRSLSSTLVPHESIKYLKKILLDGAENSSKRKKQQGNEYFSNDYFSNEYFSTVKHDIQKNLSTHQWNYATHTATDTCVFNCLLYLHACSTSDSETMNTELLEILKNTSLLRGSKAQENLNIFIKKDNISSPDIAKIFYCLKDTCLLKNEHAQANFDALIKSREANNSLGEILSNLKYTSLLKGNHAQNNFYVLTTKSDEVLLEIDSLLRAFQKNSLLNGDCAQANFDALIKSREANNSLGEILSDLKDTSLLKGNHAQNNFHVLTKKCDTALRDIAFSLRTLKETSLLNSDCAQANFEVLIQSIEMSDPKNIHEALFYLEHTPLLKGNLAKNNFNIFIKAINANAYTSTVFRYLVHAPILKGDHAQVHFDTITQKEGQYIEYFYFALSALRNANEFRFVFDENFFSTIAQCVLYTSLFHTVDYSCKNALIMKEGRNGLMNNKMIIIINHLKDTCLLKGDCASSNFKIIYATSWHNSYLDEFIKLLDFLKDTSLLKHEQAQKNFGIIVNCHNSIHSDLVEILNHLKDTTLLKGEHAQETFDAILQLRRNGAHATLKNMLLLTRKNAEANLTAITQNKGKYVNDIAEVLFHYPGWAYNDRSQLQVSFNILTKNACHAKDIADAFEHSRRNYLFVPIVNSDFHLLIQHWHCAKDIVKAIKIMEHAKKLGKPIASETLKTLINKIEIKKSTREIEKNVATLYTFFKFLPADLVTYIAAMTGNKQYHNERNAMDIAYHQCKIYDMDGYLPTLATMIKHHRLLEGGKTHEKRISQQQHIFDKQYGLTLYSNNKKHLPSNDSTINSLSFAKR